MRIPSSSLRLLALTVIGASLLGSVGCASMDDLKREQNALVTAKEQLAQAENDLNTARKQIDSLKAQLADKEAIIRAGLGGVDALMKERDLLKAQLADLQAKYDALLKSGGPVLPPNITNALKDLADQYPDIVDFDPATGRIRFKSDVTFDLGSTEVKPRAKEALAILATILNKAEIAGNEIQVVGHTDDVPIRLSNTATMNPSNWYLSTNRAHAVRQVLSADGVSDVRIEAAGWGETRPVEPNAAGHKGSAKNRRVEIFILPTMVPANTIPGDSGQLAPRTVTPRTTRSTTPRAPRPTTTAPAAPAPDTGVPMPRTVN